MKFSWAAILLLLGSTGVTSFSIPQLGLVERDAVPSESAEFVDLEKRRGGGGGGGRAGGFSGGFSGGGSGGRSSSSGSRGGSSSSSSGRTSSSSNRGGSTGRGSGVSPSYGGGRYYAGGARTPYAAGAKSPLGITPFLLPAAALAFFPGVWLYGAYAYPYTHPYYYMDEQNHKNESLPVVCLCQQYQECGCDNNNNRTYYESLFNGTVPKNTTITQVADVNGTEKIFINGTLANGTTSATSSAPASAVNLLHASGYWVTVAVVATAVWAI